MTISRDIINKNILFRDFKVEENIKNNKISEYSFNDLSNLIDYYKDILQSSYNIIPGESVLIGEPPNIHQISLFFACAELGLQVIIADNKVSNLKSEEFLQRYKQGSTDDFVDPKTKLLLPIDYLITKSNFSNKMKMYQCLSKNYIDVNNHKNINNRNQNIDADLKNFIIKCTSSGTTGTAKLVQHTQEFIKNISYRNRVFFNNNVGIMRNLNHGSSIATYFLPALMSENVKTFNSFNFTDNFKIFSYDYIKFDINHLMLPYPFLLDTIVQQLSAMGLKTNMTLYTLGTISKKNLIYFKNKVVKDIISFFGSNETSGPIFTNNISDLNFEESRYKLLDDYYKVSLGEGNILEVELPILNKKISTNDVFDLKDNFYYYRGRSDLYRVNGLTVDLEKYNEIVLSNLNGILIVDTVKNSLYIAGWSQEDELMNKINNISREIEIISEGLHKIDKFKILNKEDFLSGVKLDNELIRDYFRNYV